MTRPTASVALGLVMGLVTRVRIPDTSDAVATPDGRFITRPTCRRSTRTNPAPKNSEAPKRFELRVVEAARLALLFTSPAKRELAEAIGELWRQSCAPALTPFRPQEAAWAFTSLAPAQCRQLVDERWKPATDARKASLLAACDGR
jgi:hypothetical protein